MEPLQDSPIVALLSPDQRDELHDALYQAGEQHMAWATHAPPDATTQQRVVRAAELFERASTAQPGSQDALWALGRVRQVLGGHHGAYDAFKAALAIQPNNADAWCELCCECLAIGKPDEAVRAGQRACELKPDDPGLLANLALAYLQAGRIAEAREAVADALTRNPSDPMTAELNLVIERAAAQSHAAPTPALPD